MRTNAINAYTTAKEASKQSGQQAATRTIECNIASMEDYAKEAYSATMDQIQHDEAVANQKQSCTTFFTIFLGPIVGTLIGTAVSDGATSGDSNASSADQQAAGDYNNQVQLKQNDLNAAVQTAQQNSSDDKATDKFLQEMLDDQWSVFVKGSGS
jgi:hypothetical protein